jgi:general secretion pathway protein J
MSGPRQGGFTLLEILVALIVLGLLMAGLAQGTRFGLRAWDAEARAIAGREDLDAVDRVLRRLIASMDPGSDAEKALIQGNAQSLAFTTELPMMAAATPRLADVAIGVDAAHRLVLRWTPHLHAVRLGPPPVAREAELLRGVQRIDLPDWNAAVGAWQRQWSASLPPSLVRLRLTFRAEGRRHWPDIIAAPVRDRGRSGSAIEPH